MLTTTRLTSIAATAAVLCLALATPAVAGPPLLCHPFDIAGARSLPWTDGPSWFGPQPDYPLTKLAGDTEALLGPSTPIIARMETLRRAAIYASRDARIAADLLTRLTGRALDAKDPTQKALAYLDAGYYVEALTEISESAGAGQFRDSASSMREIVRGVDGYTLAAKALMLRPDDAGMEFATAVIASGRHMEAYPAHARKARAGVGADALLARNIDRTLR